MSGRSKGELVLSDSEREALQALTMRRKTAQALALRARIVLACADGMDNKTVSAKQRVTQSSLHMTCRKAKISRGDRISVDPNRLTRLPRRGMH